jgi:hypothetical protein
VVSHRNLSRILNRIPCLGPLRVRNS